MLKVACTDGMAEERGLKGAGRLGGRGFWGRPALATCSSAAPNAMLLIKTKQRHACTNRGAPAGAAAALPPCCLLAVSWGFLERQAGSNQQFAGCGVSSPGPLAQRLADRICWRVMMKRLAPAVELPISNKA